MTPERINHGPIDYSDVAVSAEGDVLPGDDVFTDIEEDAPRAETDIDNPQIEPDAFAAIHGLALHIEEQMNLPHPPTRRALNIKIGHQMGALVAARTARGLSTRGMVPIPGRDRAPGTLGFSPKAHLETPAQLPDTELEMLTEKIVDKQNLDYEDARRIAASQLGVKLEQ